MSLTDEESNTMNRLPGAILREALALSRIYKLEAAAARDSSTVGVSPERLCDIAGRLSAKIREVVEHTASREHAEAFSLLNRYLLLSAWAPMLGYREPEGDVHATVRALSAVLGQPVASRQLLAARTEVLLFMVGVEAGDASFARDCQSVAGSFATLPTG